MISLLRLSFAANCNISSPSGLSPFGVKSVNTDIERRGWQCDEGQWLKDEVEGALKLISDQNKPEWTGILSEMEQRVPCTAW